MLLVGLLVNSRLLVVTFLGESKIIRGFLTEGRQQHTHQEVSLLLLLSSSAPPTTVVVFLLPPNVFIKPSVCENI